MTRFASLRETAASAFGAFLVSGLFLAAAVLPAQTAAATVFHV